jgi:hypothetical protein
MYRGGHLMGIFDDIKTEIGSQQISQNGLSEGTHSERCEECGYRMFDNRKIRGTGHYICYIHRMRVGANQVCNSFHRGDPSFEVGGSSKSDEPEKKDGNMAFWVIGGIIAIGVLSSNDDTKTNSGTKHTSSAQTCTTMNETGGDVNLRQSCDVKSCLKDESTLALSVPNNTVLQIDGNRSSIKEGSRSWYPVIYDGSPLWVSSKKVGNCR